MGYSIEHRDAFTVSAATIPVSPPFDQIPAQKKAFWAKIKTDGTFAALKATNPDGIYSVNVADQNGMTFGVGVVTGKAVPGTTAIPFAAGDYLVLNASGAHPGDVSADLENQAFQQVLPTLDGYKYVGGPNCIVQRFDGHAWIGQMLVPLVTS